MTTIQVTVEALLKVRDMHQRGEHGPALAILTEVLQTSDYAEAWNLKGDLLLALGRPREAAEAYLCATERDPSSALYAHDLGRALLQSGRALEAETALSHAAALAPHDWGIHCDLGTAQMQKGDPEAAVVSFKRAVDLKDDAIIAHFNLGNALLETGRFDEARAQFWDVIRVAPNFVPALRSLATLLSDTGHRDEADAMFLHARQLSPSDALLKQAVALHLLRYGDLRRGFVDYEARFLPSEFSIAQRPFTAPLWRGETLKGKNILIWTEQGLGDEILSASTFSEIIARAKTCTIECSARAAPLFVRSFKNARVVARTDPPHPVVAEPFDFQSSSFGICAAVRRDVGDFPPHSGYLQASESLRDKLRKRYQSIRPGTPVVGISWDSTARHGARKRIPLESWRPILRLPNVTFVCLQYGVKRDDGEVARLGLKDGFYIDGDIDALSSLDASAAQVAAMDLVITVSNTTAHLAGAQGIPVWTLLPNGPGSFWYWFRGREDSPWYPSMRLFRQTAPRSWDSVISLVAKALVEVNPLGRL